MHRIIAGGLLAALTLGASSPGNIIGPATKLQAVGPTGAPAGSWTDINGQPEIVVELELAVSGPTVDLAAGGAPLATARGLDPFAVTPTLQQLGLITPSSPQGAVRLWARVYDAAGNVSDWFRADDILDSTKPKPPGGCQLLR